MLSLVQMLPYYQPHEVTMQDTLRRSPALLELKWWP